MIYTNLFKPNKSSKSKNSVHYMVESRRYKFNIIFDKKFTSILSAMAIGAIMIGSINTGIYFITTYTNSARLASLEEENNKYLQSLSQLEAQKSDYLKEKANANNIYNLSSKPTKWSSIVDNIAKQLPYDSVLTSITTTNKEEVGSLIKEAESKAEVGENTDASTESTEQPTDSNKDDITGETELNNVLSQNEDIIENDVILITGKSLSMVNLSLFLDKLDKLDIFQKVECVKAEKEEDSVYYGFIIYAILN